LRRGGDPAVQGAVTNSPANEPAVVDRRTLEKFDRIMVA
jgi:hypothetical protein